MIKQFICWLWGHKMWHTEVTNSSRIYDKHWSSSAITVPKKAKFCERCGGKL